MPNFMSKSTDFAHLHLVSGERGSGKTQVCMGLAQLLSLYNEDLAGVISPAVFTQGRKTGIEVYDLRSQQRRRLAALRPKDESQEGATLATADWTFDASGLAWGNELLQRAIPCGVLIVDELGPLEFIQGQGWTAGFAALDSRSYRLAVATVRPALLAIALKRWPGAQEHLLESGEDVQSVWTALARAAAEG